MATIMLFQRSSDFGSGLLLMRRPFLKHSHPYGSSPSYTVPDYLFSYTQYCTFLLYSTLDKLDSLLTPSLSWLLLLLKTVPSAQNLPLMYTFPHTKSMSYASAYWRLTNSPWSSHLLTLYPPSSGYLGEFFMNLFRCSILCCTSGAFYAVGRRCRLLNICSFELLFSYFISFYRS